MDDQVPLTITTTIDLTDSATMDDVQKMDIIIIDDEIDINNSNQQMACDFISQIPHEIFCEIMNQLPIQTIGECTIVNRTWRCTLLDRAPLWKKFVLQPNTGKHLFELLPKVNQHIQRLELNLQQHWMDKVAQIMLYHSFPGLDALHIHSIATSSSTPLLHPAKQTSSNQLGKVLKHLSKTLTKLQLNLVYYPGGPTYTETLNTCQRLEAFQYSSSVRPNTIPTTEQLDIVESQTLTKLSLLSCGDEFTRLNLVTLLARLPNVEYLRLDDCRFHPFDIVSSFSPNIKCLTVNSDGIAFGNLHYIHGYSENNNKRHDMKVDENCDAFMKEKQVHTVADMDIDEDSLQQGLECLAVGSMAPSRQLVSLLQKSTATLTSLCFNAINDEHCDQMDVAWAASVEFPTLTNLTHLRVANISAYDFWCLLTRIIGACPKLQVFELEDHDMIIDELDLMDILISTIVQMNSFSTLRIVNSVLDAVVPCLLFKTFAQRSSNEGVPCSLRHLEIENSSGEDDPLYSLNYMANILSLRSLKLYHSTVYGCVEFAQNVATLPELEQLAILHDSYGYVEDYIYEEQEAVLSDNRTDDEEFISWICRNQRLKSIHLDKHLKFSERVLELLGNRLCQDEYNFDSNDYDSDSEGFDDDGKVVGDSYAQESKNMKWLLNYF